MVYTEDGHIYHVPHQVSYWKGEYGERRHHHTLPQNYVELLSDYGERRILMVRHHHTYSQLCFYLSRLKEDYNEKETSMVIDPHTGSQNLELYLEQSLIMAYQLMHAHEPPLMSNISTSHFE